jgi:uncharacterized membrane protein YdjX (TVP38/TMEM64 family)
MKSLSQENKKVILKLLISALVIGGITLAAYLLFKGLGWTELTKEQLQDFIKSTGGIAPLVFIVVSFAQVTLIPIPGAVTILAGNYLFGFLLSLIYSYIGMMLGAVVAFALGRIIGRPYVNWVAGSKQKADEWIKKLKGRETVFLFFAFLLPLFPDDILCSVAGVLPISWLTFMIMQIITRFTSICGTLIFMSGEIIPYHGWGLVVLIIIFALAIVAFVVSIKYAEKLNKLFSGFIDGVTSKLKSKKTSKNSIDKKRNN